MKKWQFLINGTELELDLFNYESIKFVLSRSTEYWGYFRGASLDKLIFIKQDAKTVKQYFEDSGVNSNESFEINKLNVQAGCYESYQDGVIDYFNYREIYNNSNELIKVEVDVLSNNEQQKLKTREDIPLRIGRGKSVESEDITFYTPVDVKYNSRPIRNNGFLEIAEIYLGVPITDGELNNRDITIPTQFNVNNIDFLRQTAKSVNNTGVYTGLQYEEMALVEHSETSDTNMSLIYDIDFDYDSLNVVTNPNAIKLKLQIFTYDGVTFNLESEVVLQSNDENPGFNSANFNGNVLFDKNTFFLYRLCVECQSTLLNFTLNESTINYSYDSLSDYTENKSFMVYECFASLLEQITDRTNVFTSNIMGRTDIGYGSNGVASEIAVTNGLFLRSAVFSDGTEVEMELAFKDLYKTMDSIYGLSLWYDGEKFNIELRKDVFGDNEIPINPEEITRELFTDLLYTDIKVGNKRVKYENVNGTNEYNTELTFSSPLRVKSNKLNLVTEYNTDYLGIELARRLTFETDQNIDSKYDDKIFLARVEWNGVQWETVLGLNGGYTLVDGIILPDYAGNLDFSPKRMLLNNSDLLSAAMWKNTTEFVRFEKSDNLATLETQKTGESVVLVELENLEVSDMTNSLFVPMLWRFKVSEQDLTKMLVNYLDYFTFDLGCETVSGYLWRAEVQNGLGEITIIEKRPAASIVVNYQASFIFNGINQYINIPDNDNLSFGDGVTDSPFSLSYWCYFNGFTNQNQILYKIGEYRLRTNGTGRFFFDLISPGGNLTRRYVPTSDPTAQWVHIVCTYDGSKTNAGMKIYANGVRVDNGDQNSGTYTAMSNTGGDLKLMGDTVFVDGNGNHFTPINKELSEAEVIELYNSGLPMDINDVSFLPNVIGHWALDKRDNPLTIVNDIIGGNNGTPFNMTSANLDLINYPE